MRFVFAWIWLVAVSLVAQAAEAQSLSAVTDPYLRVQQALAADKTAGIRDEATAIVVAAGKLGKAGEPIVAAGAHLQTASGIAASRDAFYALTTALFKYADATGTTLGDGVRRAYCPMEKRTWAQKDGKISNPYDPSMPTCGRFTDGKK